MDIAEAVLKLTTAATKGWKKQRLAELRKRRTEADRAHAFCASLRTTLKDAAYEVMEEAYLQTSDDGRYPAKARQIMYVARPLVLKQTGGECWSKSDYFTQRLLPGYLREHREAQKWWVVWDARGHLIEPFTGRVVPLGGVEVENYLAEIAGRKPVRGVRTKIRDLFPTTGPHGRYQGILFCEKEGFNDLFKEVKLAERYDLAIMSTKGMTVTAARRLVDHLCHDHDLPVFVLHDFDTSGLAILNSLSRSTDRYRFRNEVRVIDLGLRLADVREHDLPTEDVHYGSDPRYNLLRNGASPEEIAFLRGDGVRGQRVELNAFTSRALVAFVEAKLRDHGVTKLVPDADTLLAQYRRAWRVRQFNERTKEIRAEVEEEAALLELPADLARRVQKRLKADPRLAWDEAVSDLTKRDR
jgi:hypothetical protein